MNAKSQIIYSAFCMYYQTQMDDYMLVTEQSRIKMANLFNEDPHQKVQPTEGDDHDVLQQLLSSTGAIEKRKQPQQRATKQKEKVHTLVALAEKGNHRVVEQKKLLLKTRNSFTTIEEYQKTIAQLDLERAKNKKTSRSKHPINYNKMKVREVLVKMEEEESDNQQDGFYGSKPNKQTEKEKDQSQKVYLPTIVDSMYRPERRDSKNVNIKRDKANIEEPKLKHRQNQPRSKQNDQKKSSRNHAENQQVQSPIVKKEHADIQAQSETVKTISKTRRAENTKTEDSKKEVSKAAILKLQPNVEQPIKKENQCPTALKQQESSPMFLKRGNHKIIQTQPNTKQEDNYNQLLQIIMKDSSQQDSGQSAKKKQQAKPPQSEDKKCSSSAKPKSIEETKTTFSQMNPGKNVLKQLHQKMRQISIEKERLSQQQKEVQNLILQQQERVKMEEERLARQAQAKRKQEAELLLKKQREEEAQRKMQEEAKRNRQERQRRERQQAQKEAKYKHFDNEYKLKDQDDQEQERKEALRLKEKERDRKNHERHYKEREDKYISSERKRHSRERRNLREGRRDSRERRDPREVRRDSRERRDPREGRQDSRDRRDPREVRRDSHDKKRDSRERRDPHERKRDSRDRNRSRDHKSRHNGQHKRKSKNENLHEKRERKYREEKQNRHSKHRDRSYSGSESSSSSKPQKKFDWRKEVQKITRYNPQDEIYLKRDKQKIVESGFDEVTREERISRAYGIREEEEQLQREQRAQKKRKVHQIIEY